MPTKQNVIDALYQYSKTNTVSSLPLYNMLYQYAGKYSSCHSRPTDIARTVTCKRLKNW